MDTVRVPLSVLPYEDQSASYQRQLKAQKLQQEAKVVSEPADEEEATAEAVSIATVEAGAKAAEDTLNDVSEASAPVGGPAEEETAASKPSEDTTATPSDSPKKE